MVLDLIVTKTNDGITAEVPTIKGCETWAHDEETAIEKIIELLEFYIKLPKDKIRLDRARKEDNKTIYKMIFDKQAL
jgi:predicted RNase H-like HicB family nuclease